jgi:hypothetical protein
MSGCGRPEEDELNMLDVGLVDRWGGGGTGDIRLNIC